MKLGIMDTDEDQTTRQPWKGLYMRNVPMKFLPGSLA